MLEERVVALNKTVRVAILNRLDLNKSSMKAQKLRNQMSERPFNHRERPKCVGS